MQKKEYDSHSDEEDDVVEEVEVRKQNIKVQRSSVSAEVFGAFNKKDAFQARVIQKSPETKANIESRLNQAFMFKALDPNEKQIVIDAMEENKFKAGDWVITQGEEGDVLYIIEQGELTCTKQYFDKPEPVYLKTYYPGEFFGELALLYNAPRAASIQAKSDCLLYALDRQTFNHIVKDSAMRKRQKYEDLLVSWDLLKTVTDPYDKAKIADAFDSESYQSGQTIIKQGDGAKGICIVESGEVVAVDKQKKVLFKFGPKDYFGEIPILFRKQQPFNFVSNANNTSLLVIAASSYKTTLEIIEQTLRQTASKYDQYLK